MNPMNDQRFFDLAMKAIAGQSTEAERAELDALVVSQPELKSEWEKLKADTRLAKEVLPLATAAETATGELPAYARERLQTKVRETLGRPPLTEKKAGWHWQWLLVLAPVTAVVVMLFVILGKPAEPVVQLALLDLAGTIRGQETNEVSILNQQWKEAAILKFEKLNDLETWEKTWPRGNQPVVKVVYDRAAGEVRVLGRQEGKLFQKAFTVEGDLATALGKAAAFIKEQARR